MPLSLLSRIPMIRIDFTPAEIDALYEARLHHPHHRVRQKLDALYLKSQGLSHQAICRITRITKATLVSYLKAYVEGGLETLRPYVSTILKANWISIGCNWKHFFATIRPAALPKLKIRLKR
tara:strand:- start:720 stop:1085 length:366 start_codon:yes stop_codon:yes gene_type:complete